MSGIDPLALKGILLQGHVTIERALSETPFSVGYRGVFRGLGEPMSIKAFRVSPKVPGARVNAFVQALGREAAHLSALSADGAAIPALVSFGCASTGGSLVPYLGTAWLDGQSLVAELEHRTAAVPIAEVGAWFGSIAAVLEIAHLRGLVHRDVCPATLFVEKPKEGAPRLRIVDFGVSALLETWGAELSAGSAFEPKNVAPEQLDPSLGEVGPPADVFALALSMLEALLPRLKRKTGPLAHRKKRSVEPQDRPTPKRLGLALAPNLAEVFDRALAIRPAERYPSAGAFFRALGAVDPAFAMPHPGDARVDHRPVEVGSNTVTDLHSVERSTASKESRVLAEHEAVATEGTPPAPTSDPTAARSGPAPESGAGTRGEVLEPSESKDPAELFRVGGASDPPPPLRAGIGRSDPPPALRVGGASDPAPALGGGGAKEPAPLRAGGANEPAPALRSGEASEPSPPLRPGVSGANAADVKDESRAPTTSAGFTAMRDALAQGPWPTAVRPASNEPPRKVSRPLGLAGASPTASPNSVSAEVHSSVAPQRPAASDVLLSSSAASPVSAPATRALSPDLLPIGAPAARTVPIGLAGATVPQGRAVERPPYAHDAAPATSNRTALMPNGPSHTAVRAEPLDPPAADWVNERERAAAVGMARMLPLGPASEVGLPPTASAPAPVPASPEQPAQPAAHGFDSSPPDLLPSEPSALDRGPGASFSRFPTRSTTDHGDPLKPSMESSRLVVIGLGLAAAIILVVVAVLAFGRPSRVPRGPSQTSASLPPSSTSVVAITSAVAPTDPSAPIAASESPVPSSASASSSATGAPEVGPVFDPAAAQAALASVPGTQSCRKLNGPRGKWKATVTFEPTGKVGDVDVEKPFVRTPAGKCVKEHLKLAEIPPFSGASHKLTTVVTIAAPGKSLK